MLDPPRIKARLSSEHFSVDGTLIATWADSRRGVLSLWPISLLGGTFAG